MKVTLTTRFGREKENPSEDDLRRALHELEVENDPSVDYEEFNETTLERLEENGRQWTLYWIQIDRDRVAEFVKYNDKDDDAADFETTMRGIDRDRALQLWMMLKRGEIEPLTKEGWDKPISSASRPWWKLW